jgi:cytochrome c oxidase subunit 1
VLLTAFVTAPTVLTIFTIPASLEIAGRLRGGRGVFGWIAALPWDRPMVLASGFSFVMLGFGGLGGLINMAYGMNAMIHNTAWVTAHFHLIYGGTSVIMYFAIAYELWPYLTGRQHQSLAPLRWQLWLSLAGGLLLLASALLFIRNLAVLHRSVLPTPVRSLYALAVDPPRRVPVALNGFGLWNVLVLVAMLMAYGYPIAQFVIAPSPTAIVHRAE